MCGILAILMRNIENKSDWEEKVKKLLDKMAHRGPDAEKITKMNSIIFGHRRLAILDLSEGGIQPMTSHDGRFIIIHNGEIYNFIEIREELKKLGKEFHTDSDTEVILTGFSVYGFDFIKMMNGMFSFIIWDKEKEELIIIRDRFGIKPLYYAFIEDDIIFSSEIKPILSVKSDLKYNERMVYDYMTYSIIAHTNETFFEEVHLFPAGHYAVITKENKKSRNITFEKYWDIHSEVKDVKVDSSFKQRSTQDHIEEVKRLFFDSVKLRLRSDVVAGSCLSGGIDSSSIVSVVSELLEGDARSNFETFSMVYDTSFEKNEQMFSEMVTKKTHFHTNQITPTIDKINEVFDDFLVHQEEPVLGMSPIGQYFVMKLAKDCGTTVLLDGQGADEILAGYTTLQNNYFFELLRKLRWIKLTRALLKANKDNDAIRSFLRNFIPYFVRRNRQRKRMRLFLTDKFSQTGKNRKAPQHHNERKSLNKALIDRVLYHIPHLLQWEDRNSMAFSIEARVPFLDHNLVTYFLALPPSYKIRNGLTKWIFRESMKGITPGEILLRRDKIGFAVPENKWLYSNLEIIEDLKTDLHKLLTKICKIDEIKNLLNKRENKILTTFEERMLFKIACLNKWFKLFFKV
ncbi:MAG: asparagine synthase (glutamine-hydrolyzing) [Candidatus Heimdallarchaeota archaeon]